MSYAQFEIERNDWLAFGGNIKFRLMENLQSRCLRLMAMPYRESVRELAYVRQRWKRRETPWHNSWWARFLRRFRWLPYPVRALVTAKEWHLTFEKETWPSSMLDKIQVQMAVLLQRGLKPMAICCGPVGNWKLHKEAEDSCVAWAYRPMLIGEDPGVRQLFGLPVRVIPWLAEGEVMVV